MKNNNNNFSLTLLKKLFFPTNNITKRVDKIYTMPRITNTERGFTHEYLIIQLLCLKYDTAYTSNTITQKKCLQNRKAYHDNMKTKHPIIYKKIFSLASTTIELLPQPFGEVLCVEQSANGNEVADVFYRDKRGKRIAISCKLTSTEDKTWRCNTNDYLIPTIHQHNQKFFTQENQENNTTFLQSLQEKNYTVNMLQKDLVNITKNIITTENKNSEDYIMLMKIIRERVIGHGDYYKTLANGDIIYYPEQKEDDILHINKNTIRTTPTTILFTISLYDNSQKLKQLYDVSFRFKFKDGKNKPVKLHKINQGPSNIATTIRLTLLPTLTS